MKRAPQSGRCLPLEEWPDQDRRLWGTGLLPGHPFDDPKPAASLAPDSIHKARKGYGRWLDFLIRNGWLDPEQPPVDRATEQMRLAYLRQLKQAGLADYTIAGRFQELAMALRILQPDRDASHVRYVRGRTVYSLLQKKRLPKPAPEADVLADWVLQLLDGAASQSDPLREAIQIRDALILGVLAWRARRLRSIALLRVGHELIRTDMGYRIELGAHQVKTKKPDHFTLPSELTAGMDRYLHRLRPVLLGSHSHDALWVCNDGRPMGAKAIQHMVGRRTKERFGFVFGPHRFRHAASTTAVLRDPAHPGLAAGLLGISASIVEQHYNLAGQSRAATDYAKILGDRQKMHASKSR